MKAFKRLILSLTIVTFVGAQTANAGGAADAAGSAIQVAMMVVGMSAVTGTALSVPCKSGTSPATCILMGLALAQVGLGLLNKKGSAKSQATLTGIGLSEGGSEGVNNADPSGTYTLSDGTVVTGETARTANALAANGLGALSDQYVKDAQTVRSSGVQVSEDGQSVKLPDGKTIPSSAMSSPEGMKNAGFSNAEVSSAQNALSDIQKNSAAMQSKVASLTNDVGGGGGVSGYGAGSGGGSGSGSGSGDASAYGRLGLNGKNKANVSGMSKKFGNDNIGVAGDDIFEMVSRRYQSKDKVDTFLKN